MATYEVEKHSENFQNIRLLDDMWSMIVGHYINEGVYRDVYENKLNPDTVVKVQKISGMHHFDNVMEMKLWESVQYADNYKKWFAPCLFLSPNGRILIQRKTQPLRKGEFPKKIPAFLWDEKMDNWGMFRGQPVCHDYGNFNLVTEDGWKLKRARIR